MQPKIWSSRQKNNDNKGYNKFLYCCFFLIIVQQLVVYAGLDVLSLF